MKLLLLLCYFHICRWTDAQERTYLVTGPKVLRLGAIERVVIQLFGYEQDSTFTVSLKSYPDKLQTFASSSVTLTAANQHQGTITLTLLPNDFPKSGTHVYLEARSSDFTKEEKLLVSRENGYLFIQTDKPLYNPEDSVKVRVFSFNAELKPALRPVILTFIDPEAVVVEMVEMRDVSGIISLQNPFKIPIKPKYGVWKIEAAYASEFSTRATAQFEVKEYVLPSISVIIQPEAIYISGPTFTSFKFSVTARYTHGAAVSAAQVFVRFGYIDGQKTVMMPNTLANEEMMEGTVDVLFNAKEALKLHGGPMSLEEMEGKFLYIVATVQEMTGGISQDADLATVRFLQSPYTMVLVATPPFIKPGLPYYIRVLVKDPVGKPVGGVPVKIHASQTNDEGEEMTLNYSTAGKGQSQTSKSDGTAVFVYNIPSDSKAVLFSLETADKNLPSINQATLSFEANSYYSVNKRYLYIDWASEYRQLTVGRYVTINIYFKHYHNIPLKTFSYLIISKGKIVKFSTIPRVGDIHFQAINFEVTSDMVPSARLLVYYIMSGETSAELVADSVWMDVKDKCVNGLQMELSTPKEQFKPKGNLTVEVKSRHNSLVAFSSVDTALYNLRDPSKDPINRVLSHIERSDQGCGGGGGKDNSDVFRLAGLTFITNANAKAIQPEDGTCSAIVRPKRYALPTELAEKVSSYKEKRVCCQAGMRSTPTLETCSARAKRLRKPIKIPKLECQKIFTECCEESLKYYSQSGNVLILARMAIDIQLSSEEIQLSPQSLRVRSYFPESWLWEVHRVTDRSGHMYLRRSLPDSLTTWEIKSVGIFDDGICVSDPLRVEVTQKFRVDVPMPYSMVRGEQIELRGSVYNDYYKDSWFCVTLTAARGVCLFQGEATGYGSTQSTPCVKKSLNEKSVNMVSFTLMALEVGIHTLKFTLKSPLGSEVLIKKLCVVPEGIKTEKNVGGTLDPRGIYGPLKRKLEFQNSIPPDVVPKSSVERYLTVSGEFLGDMLEILDNPKGLYQLTGLPRGSAEVEIMGILPIYYVYDYLEKTDRWDLMDHTAAGSKVALKRKMKDGLNSIMSFKSEFEASYSMWKDREASTWLTALVIKTLGKLHKYVTVDHVSLCNSIFWLESNRQNVDGSFKELSTYKPVKLMGAGADVTEQTAYLTSFTIIGIKNAMAVPECQLMGFKIILEKATEYLSSNIENLKSRYVQAITAYALALVDQGSMPARELYQRIQNNACEKGTPPVFRFWQEGKAGLDPSAPNKMSAQSVETTVYVLLTALLYGENQYITPILRWLTQDQRYGGGFHSTQDTILTLEALSEYRQLTESAKLDMEIRASYRNMSELKLIKISQTHPLSSPIKVTFDEDVILKTGLSSGVSVANLKTVYYSMSEPKGNCHFDLTIEIHPPERGSSEPMLMLPRLIACAKYKPTENEVYLESSHTVMEIHLPTGVQPFQDDLDMIQNGLDSLISNYEIQGDQVILQVDSVPSDTFLCAGFRIQKLFRTGMASSSQFKVYEYHEPDSQCSKLYTLEESRLLRLCQEGQCQCMAAECSNFKPPLDLTITADMRQEAACQNKIRYAFKVIIVSSLGEGDFVSYKAKIKDIFKKGNENLQRETEVTFVKKATCIAVDLLDGVHYLVMGVEGMQIEVQRSYKYVFPLDSEAWVEKWPSSNECNGIPGCSDFVETMEVFAENILLMGCQ